MYPKKYFLLFLCLAYFTATVTELQEKSFNIRTESSVATSKDFLDQVITKQFCQRVDLDYPSYDGWFNNLLEVDMGAKGKTNVLKSKETRLHCLRPNVTSIIFDTLAMEALNEIGHFNTAECKTKNAIDIHIPDSRYIQNCASSFIDGGMIYGNNQYSLIKNMLSNNGSINISQLVGEEIANKSFWLEWHNKIAERISDFCPSWSPEKVFNQARIWTIATQQSVYVYRLFRSTLDIPKYRRYDPTPDQLILVVKQAKVDEQMENIIQKYIQKLRDRDRFWFEKKQNNMFDSEEIEKIKKLSQEMSALTITPNNFLPLQLINERNTTENNTRNRPLQEYFTYPFIFLIPVLIGLGAICLVVKRQQCKAKLLEEQECISVMSVIQEKLQITSPVFSAKEIRDIQVQQIYQWILVILIKEKKQIVIKSFSGNTLRVIDVGSVLGCVVNVIRISDEPIIIIQFPDTYDLVLKFVTFNLQNTFSSEFDTFANGLVQTEMSQLKWKSIKSRIKTVKHRQKGLEMFFRVAFAQAFKIEHSHSEILEVDTYLAKEVIDTKISIYEFAQSLDMNPGDEFVKTMFSLVDRDKNGFISFREFIDLIILFADKNNEERARLFFDMYDINGTGLIDAKDFQFMTSSFFAIVREQSNVQKIGLNSKYRKKEAFDFKDFRNVIRHDIQSLNKAHFNFDLNNRDDDSHLATARIAIESMMRKCRGNPLLPHVVQTNPTSNVNLPNHCGKGEDILESSFKDQFSFLLPVFLNLSVFCLSVFFMRNTNERLGKDYVFHISRGCKYNILMNYSVLLITLCKSLKLKLRSSSIDRYIDFESLFDIHNTLVYMTTFFTVLHVGIEYHILIEDLFTSDRFSCVLQKYMGSPDQSKINPLLLSDLVVITGFCLTILQFTVFLICLFQRYGKLKNLSTHYLFILTAITAVIHGLQSQNPLTQLFLSGPAILYVLDLSVSLEKKYLEVPLVCIENSPSDILCLVLKNTKFRYKVGQWGLFALKKEPSYDFHLLPISASPYEQFLRLYISSNTYWEQQLRDYIEGPKSQLSKAPVQFIINGSYGTGYQYWSLYKVVIIIGSGSAIVPISALLRDFKNFLEKCNVKNIKKVYFVWVTKTQKRCEWIMDIFREIEKIDSNQCFSCSIYITEAFENFNLRNLFLYIIEKHYQRLKNKCLFTNMKAVVNFGYPDFYRLFGTIKSLHPMEQIGVFSGGTLSLSLAIEKICFDMNFKSERVFEHHYI